MAELKPCPFCGSDRVMITRPITWQAWCANCKAIGPWKVEKQDAIAAWNRRCDPEVDDE